MKQLGKVEFSDDGAPLRMSGINLDITDQKRAELALRQSEAALRQSQQRLRLAVDAGRLTYAEFDLQTGLAYAAENYEQVMGYRPLRVSGGADKDAAISHLLEHIAPDDRQRVVEAVREYRAGRPSSRIEYRVVGDDGVERWIAGFWNAEPGPGGRPARVTVTLLDITPQIKAKKELEAAKDRANEILASIADGSMRWIGNGASSISTPARRSCSARFLRGRRPLPVRPVP